jgi:hypothetical protein
MLEKTEGLIINQEWTFRDIGNIGFTRHRTNTNKTQKCNPRQKKKMSNMDSTKNKG